MNEEMVNEENQILTESCRSFVSSTRKNLHDDLTEA